ncbi:hypothetical protein ABIE49_006404 [Bradyrhizobium sp. OAE829]
MSWALREIAELVLAGAAFLAGAAVLYLFSFGRVRPRPVSQWWGIQRLGNGRIGVDPEWVAVFGMIVFFALAGVAIWLGWLH